MICTEGGVGCVREDSRASTAVGSATVGADAGSDFL